VYQAQIGRFCSYGAGGKNCLISEQLSVNAYKLMDKRAPLVELQRQNQPFG
jgi:hypothetical protein